MTCDSLAVVRPCLSLYPSLQKGIYGAIEAVCGPHRAPFPTGALRKPRESEAICDGSLRLAFGPSTLQPPHRTHHKLWRDSPSSIFIFSHAQPLWRAIHGFFQRL